MSITPEQLSEWWALAAAAPPDMQRDRMSRFLVRASLDDLRVVIASFGGSQWSTPFDPDGTKWDRYQQQLEGALGLLLAARTAVPALLADNAALRDEVAEADRAIGGLLDKCRKLEHDVKLERDIRDNWRGRTERAESEVARLRTALLVVLDQVDYTRGACGVTEKVGGVLSTQVIALARAALAGRTEGGQPKEGA